MNKTLFSFPKLVFSLNYSGKMNEAVIMLIISIAAYKNYSKKYEYIHIHGIYK